MPQHGLQEGKCPSEAFRHSSDCCVSVAEGVRAWGGDWPEASVHAQALGLQQLDGEPDGSW